MTSRVWFETRPIDGVHPWRRSAVLFYFVEQFRYSYPMHITSRVVRMQFTSRAPVTSVSHARIVVCGHPETLTSDGQRARDRTQRASVELTSVTQFSVGTVECRSARGCRVTTLHSLFLSLCTSFLPLQISFRLHPISHLVLEHVDRSRNEMSRLLACR